MAIVNTSSVKTVIEIEGQQAKSLNMLVKSYIEIDKQAKELAKELETLKEKISKKLANEIETCQESTLIKTQAITCLLKYRKENNSAFNQTWLKENYSEIYDACCNKHVPSCVSIQDFKRLN